LIAEVLSPSEQQRDRIEKRDLYEQFGVKEYWIIDPETRSVEVLTLNSNRQYALAGRYSTGETAWSRLLPGFGVALAYLFGGR
jgi:Uma2 family endonuclease